MRGRRVSLGVTLGCVALLGLVAVGAAPWGGEVQARGSLQPAATATVHARQTATAQARATEAARQPTPPPATATPVTSTGNVVTPEQRAFSEATLRRLQLPAGFYLDVYAQGLGNTRMMAVAPDGTVYVTRREQGDVLALPDANGDGHADGAKVIASDLPYINGITLRGSQLYLATDHKVLVGNLQSDHTLKNLKAIIDDLPDAGQHPNRTLAFGPDGKLYITVGSTCNACADTNPQNATIMVANADGSDRQVLARGLRNTIGFDWHPGSGQLWAMDQGSDWRGDDQPPEELNLIQAGGNYGWPYCYANRQPDKYFQGDPPGTTKEAYCPTTLPTVLTYTAHSAPLNFLFTRGTQFPAEYSGDAFATMRGSWNRTQPSGYKVVRVRYQNGWPVSFEDFLTGFLDPTNNVQYGRLAGLAFTPYGSLLVADDANGVIYRVSWAGTH